MPGWLAAALGLLLVLLIIIVVTGLEEPQPAKPVVAAAKPEIIFEEPIHQATPEPEAVIPDAPEPEQQMPVPEPLAVSGIGLIVDDVGFDLHALERILNLSVPVAIAVLPGAPYARRAATLAHESGQVVMLHLPMEPSTPKYREKMTDTFLRADMSGDELRQLFLRNLEKVPYAEGVNNHMGSELTELREPMSQVMQLCREKGLFFIDSKTSNRSVASELAGSMNVPWASRRFFLDHSSDEAAMAKAWEGARACAAKGYSCIVIAHPHAETVSFLESHLSESDKHLLQPLKQLLKSNPLQAGKQADTLKRAL